MVHRLVMLFTAMSGPEPSAAAGDPRTVRLALELLERTAGHRRRCRRMPKRHRRERAKARSGLVVSAHRALRPSRTTPAARDRTGAHPAMPGVPNRHRPPASRRPDLRRRLQKRALADLAPPPAPPGTLTRGGPRWPNPPRTSTIRPTHAGPPTCSGCNHRVFCSDSGQLFFVNLQEET